MHGVAKLALKLGLLLLQLLNLDRQYTNNLHVFLSCAIMCIVLEIFRVGMSDDTGYGVVACRPCFVSAPPDGNTSRARIILRG